jgi:hypothetical protein
MVTPLKNPGPISYTAEIIQSDRHTNSWAWVEFPYDLKETYGKGNLVPVTVTFDGISYQGSVTKMGGDNAQILVKREVLAAIGKTKGDAVNVTVLLDDKPRQVDVPPELEAVLAQNPQAKLTFDFMSYSHRKEYAVWVSSAKQAETKRRRAEQVIIKILDSKKER